MAVDLKGFGKEAVVVYFSVLLLHFFPGKTKENRDISE
jgi:hypothetical protein